MVDPRVVPDLRTVADTQLKPMNQDEFILGFQRALTKQLTVGVKGTYRKINAGIAEYLAANGMSSVGELIGSLDAPKKAVQACAC